jgi:lysozyme family protein
MYYNGLQLKAVLLLYNYMHAVHYTTGKHVADNTAYHSKTLHRKKLQVSMLLIILHTIVKHCIARSLMLKYSDTSRLCCAVSLL